MFTLFKKDPWYKKKQQPLVTQFKYTKKSSNSTQAAEGLLIKKLFQLSASSWIAGICLVISALSFYYSFISLEEMSKQVIIYLISLSFFILSLFFFVRQVGYIFYYFFPDKCQDTGMFSVGIKFLKGELKKDEVRKGIPAPELVLNQFVQQVKAYATEKSFQKFRGDGEKKENQSLTLNDNTNILKRRWNDVADSLNEFEIYLANDPQGMISNLITRSNTQVMDVAQVFRDVADTFDNTWRRRGINIESAIVTPLKAKTNEAILRRLLVGPWRTAVNLARRGDSVIFTAKAVEGKTIARWECMGTTVTDDFIQQAKDSTLPVNERIELGMKMIALDPNSPTILNAMISFIIWIDFANALQADYSLKQSNEGLVIELRLGL